MINILITGSNSYIGRQLELWLNKTKHNYSITRISLRNGIWKTMDFSKYDVIYHAAGIAHIKETKANSDLYQKVNRDLSFQVALKAKKEKVHQFVFLSSMSVYGTKQEIITLDTFPNPETYYGLSKLHAEQLLESLSDESFKVAILRLPMVYGLNSKGNFTKLKNFVCKCPIFPYINNQRSMIYIDNVSEISKQIIDDQSSGVFYPQNNEYVCTGNLVKLIGRYYGKPIILSKGFAVLLRAMKLPMVKKLTGNLVYDKSMSEYKREYRVCNLEESIQEISNQEMKKT